MMSLRNENGITMAMLVATVIILLIIISVSINLGIKGVDSSKDKQDFSVLYMVQQAALGQYSKAVALGNDDDLDVSNEYIGEKIYDISDINVSLLPASISSPFPTQTEYSNIINSSTATNKDFYYRLKTNDLKKLKIVKPGDSEDVVSTEELVDTYIVNYKTGEVYNETKQVTKSNNKILYIKGESIQIDKTQKDTTSFTD